jgi:hypothetical protein
MALIVCPACNHSISDAAIACIWCGRPNQPVVPVHENRTLEAQQSISDSVIAERRPPFFDPIAIHKLVVMSGFTFGIYQIHWFYRQWNYIRMSERRGFNPAIRALFNGIFAYPLFRAIKQQGIARGVRFRWSPVVLAILWISLTIFSVGTGLRGFVGFAAVLPLIIVQSDINRLNNRESIDGRYNGANIVGIAIGAALWTLLSLGAYVLLTKGSVTKGG